MKKYFAFTAFILLVSICFLVNVKKAQAGVFGKYGNLKAIIESDGNGGIQVGYDCNYSLKSNCDRESFQ
jgi:hypothetical protein